MQEGVKLSQEKQYPFLSSFGVPFLTKKRHRCFPSIPLRDASERLPVEPAKQLLRRGGQVQGLKLGAAGDHLRVVVAGGPGDPAQNGHITIADVPRGQLRMLDEDGRLPIVGDPSAEVGGGRFPHPAGAAAPLSRPLEIPVVHVLGAAHEPDHVIACPLEMLAYVEEAGLH